MGLMDKVKNLFTEEVEEPKPIKKEVRHVEIPAPKKEIEPVHTTREEKNTITDSSTIKKEEKFVFPVYFDDKDFDDLEKPKKEKKVDKPQVKEAYSGSIKKENPSEEVKTFKPSLIISPVYGVLNKNYHKEDISTKRENKNSNYYKKSNKVTIDDIRDKAYGTLEDELKNNILGNEQIYNDQKEDTEKAIDLLNELDFDKLDKEENNFDKNEKNNNDFLSENKNFDDDTAFLAQQLEEQKRKLDEINDYIKENTVEKKPEEKNEDFFDELDQTEIKENSNDEEIFDELNNEKTLIEEKEKNEDFFDESNFDELNDEKDNNKEPDLTESELFNMIDSMYDDKEES